MSEQCKQGATMQGYNDQLVKHIEEMRRKRDDLDASISKEMEEKCEIQAKIALLSAELKGVEERLESKETIRKGYEKVIRMSEDAYDKILDSSKTLLTLMKKESDTLKQQLGTTAATADTGSET